MKRPYYILYTQWTVLKALVHFYNIILSSSDSAISCAKHDKRNPIYVYSINAEPVSFPQLHQPDHANHLVNDTFVV